MSRRDRAWRGAGERSWSGAGDRPWYTKGIERVERPRPAAGAPRYPGPGYAGDFRARYAEEYPTRYADEFTMRSVDRFHDHYPDEYAAPYAEEYAAPYADEYTARRPHRPRRWRRGRPVSASEVPRGRVERWWYAIGPERRQDYAWVYGARRPERYGWTGETGRDGGPGSRRRGRRNRERESDQRRRGHW